MVDLPSREALRNARRVCVKAGTGVVANEDGSASLTRVGSLAEQIAELCQAGVEVILVSSGSVGMGKRLLRRQANVNLTFKELQEGGTREGNEEMHRTASFTSLLDIKQRPHTFRQKKQVYDSACAAAGQFEMMSLYNALFSQCDLVASQILVTQADFSDEKRIQNLKYAIERLLSLGIVPIINENDAVSANAGYTPDDIFSDNDSLAALCARSFDAEVLLLLTDVPGVFDRPPSEKDAKLIRHYSQDSSEVEIGMKSSLGRGGMRSKIDAASAAVQPGSSCRACVVASGNDLNSVRSVLGKSPEYKSTGTLFCTPGSELDKQAREDYPVDGGEAVVSDDAREKAVRARAEARKLQALPYEVRKSILCAMAKALIDNQEVLLAANSIDVEDAEKNGVSLVLKKRLKLTAEKLNVLASGLNQLAELNDPLNVTKSKRELSEGLVLSQITVPIGVLLIIFESRPDSMPQISALSIASGNGLLLKGGKEAASSNAAIHKVLGDAVEKGSDGKVSSDIIGLVTSRGEVADLLSLDEVIDLVIPRGSNALVSHIKANTKIPVLGHADGVCHVYIDSSAAKEDASRIAVDSKTDYPSACNAMETLLLHRGTINSGVGPHVLMSLRAAGVKCLGGPKAMAAGLCDSASIKHKFEYGDLTCQVEIVENLDEAVDWIHKYGSGHTEAIVCSPDADVGDEFVRRVDAACVFKNSSTRFADGFRFGLGAEVGISTGRIHARGPVGVEGLLTTKWKLVAAHETHIVSEYAGEQPAKLYTHKELDV